MLTGLMRPVLGAGFALCVTLVALAPLASAQRIAAPVERLAGAEPAPQSDAQVLEELRWRFGDLRGEDAPEHVSAHETCLRPLLTRVRALAPRLSPEHRAELAALSAHVGVALATGLRVAGDASAVAAQASEGDSQLPLMPELELRLEGKDCIVHYTLTGPNAAPDLGYVKAIRSAVDKAAKKMSKAFRRPYYEPADDGIDKLHVFVHELDLDPDLGDALAAVSDVQDAPGSPFGKQQTVYMAFDTGLREYATSVGQNWKKVVKGTAFHEFMHCIQSAYNAFTSRWAVEGQAVWAELKIGKYKDGVAGYSANPLSIFNSPELPLWHDSIHQYSTAPLFFYLEFFEGKGANKRFLEASLDANDALTILEFTLFESFNFFDEFYPPYLARLYQKKIKGISKKLLPDFAVMDSGVNSYGWKTSDAVMPTGVHVYEFDAPPGLKTDLLFARVGGAGNKADGLLLHAKKKRLVLPGFGGWDTVEKFRGKAKAVLMVTDWDYDGPVVPASSFTAELFVPFLDIKKVETNSPVPFGQQVEVTFTYDLLGTPSGLSKFGVILYHERKGPKQPKVVQFLSRNLDVGVAEEHTETFSVGKAGTYKLHYTARTPGDAYGGEHVNDKVNKSVKVKKP